MLNVSVEFPLVVCATSYTMVHAKCQCMSDFKDATH